MNFSRPEQLHQLDSKSEFDTDDVVEISQSFICNKCGTELTINRQSVVANEPPKHCKDPMEPLD